MPWWFVAWSVALAGEPAMERSYRVDAGDVLRVDIYGESDLSGLFSVGPDGAALPLIGNVPLRGQTVDEAARAIRERLAGAFLRDPQVSVRVETYASKPVQVLGAVEKPGTYFLNGPTTLLEILARAGDIDSEHGVVKQVQWRRGEQTEQIDLQRLLAAGTGDRLLESGDVVYVPEGWVVYVSGQVEKPGEVPFIDGLTVARALATAGGAKKTARLKEAYILREGERIAVPLRAILRGRSPDVTLKPGDQLFLEEAVF
jgi:polysaccharide export outer membrane protein